VECGLQDEEIAERLVPDGWAGFLDTKTVRRAISVLRHRGTGSGETLLKDSKGETVLVEFRASWVPLKPEGAGLIILAAHDQRRQQKLAHVLRENIWQHRLVMDNMPHVGWVADSTGRLVYLSPNVRKICGFLAHDVVEDGWSFWWRRVHPDDRATVETALAYLVSYEQSFDVRYRFQSADSTWIWLRDRAEMAADPTGEPMLTGVISDITDQMNENEERASLSTDTAAARTFPVDIHTLIHEVADLLALTMDRRVLITVQLSARESVISGDPSAVQNALVNLMLNTFNAMPNGDHLRLSTSNVDRRDAPQRTTVRWGSLTATMRSAAARLSASKASGSLKNLVTPMRNSLNSRSASPGCP
jgi:PAS domain S-box-containing protein